MITKKGLDRKIMEEKGILTIHIAMIVRSDLLSLPPLGHLGCYASLTPFEAKVGQPVQFYSEAGLAAEGIVVALEKPGLCLREDMLKFLDWHKLHWVPTTHEILSQQILKISGTDCPECGARSSVTDSHRKDGTVIRTRQCSKHKHLRWRTIEIIAGTISNSKRGRPKIITGPKGSRGGRS